MAARQRLKETAVPVDGDDDEESSGGEQYVGCANWCDAGSRERLYLMSMSCFFTTMYRMVLMVFGMEY